VPQIFVDKQHIGGFTDFAAWVEQHPVLSPAS
jgi:glutaredoxin 1